MGKHTVTLTDDQLEILEYALITQANTILQQARNAQKNGHVDLSKRLAADAHKSHELYLHIYSNNL